MFTKLIELLVPLISNESDTNKKIGYFFLSMILSLILYFGYTIIMQWIIGLGELKVHDLKLQEQILNLKDKEINKLTTQNMALTESITLLTNKNHDLEMSDLRSSLTLKVATEKIKILNSELRQCLIKE